jgi:hypothetical protein
VAQTFRKNCWKPRKTRWIWFLIWYTLVFGNNLLVFLGRKSYKQIYYLKLY